VVVLAVTGVLTGLAAWKYWSAPQSKRTAVAAPNPGPSGAGAGLPPSAAAAPTPAVETFAFSTTQGSVLGSGGTIKRFRVAVQTGTGQDVNAFAADVDKILGDSRGWVGGGQVRFQRVPQSAAFDFTVFLATPATSEAMCQVGGLYTEQVTSCRLPAQVIINLARWTGATAEYGAPIDV